MKFIHSFPSQRPSILTQHSLSQTPQFQVGILESVFQLVVQRLLFAVQQDGGAAVQNPLWGAFHHQQVVGPRFRCAILMNGKLEAQNGGKSKDEKMKMNDGKLK